MNTGRIGGSDDDERSKKVKIPHSSAVLEGIVSGTIDWEEDPDFGYAVAADLPNFPDEELLQPRRLYQRQGRMEEFHELVANLKEERREYLGAFVGLHDSILDAV